MLQVAMVVLRRRLVLAASPSVSAGAAAAVGGSRRLGLASLANLTTQRQQHLQKHRQQQSNNSLVWTRAFHASTSSRMMAEVVMTVPSMGDSITEGTIKSWEKNVGDVVALDDVVVVIETDKVSVDIRAKDKGILVEQFAAVDDNVDVGANLLKIDTSATASASAPSAAQKLVPSDTAPDAAPASVPAPASAPASDPAPTTASEVQRKPLIKFLGKRSLIGKDIPAAASAAQMARTGAAATGPAPRRYEDLKSTPGSKTFDEMPAMFGRPSLSEKEIEAIESGGATL